MIAPEYNNDRYTWQTKRQNIGLTCTDCGSHRGHFSICPLFHKGLPSTYNNRIDQDELTMEDVLGKPQPDSQSFYRKAQQKVRDEAFTKEDIEYLKEMKIKL